ncbi:MAG: Asp-tRNA(Asn)/Glu-tRNA(Gln) amidotransferase subunit GatB [Dethiobacter sp.]|jgi:aspartyl-tRNA(Asn)/glutamyl-tRNA(Gln) amidotransferase subunit B|nr:Asp-tRNA(Asn)/Glu-tRNA(Gln) amidotransferase subunit GatB [Dethiobacter sp.]
MKQFEPVIGLEVHVELLTKTKLFCRCGTTFGKEPNVQVCPICLGLPGHRPSLNRSAVEYAIKASLALNCEITEYTTFDRKNYFYCDLPKGYQISQFFYPTGTNGYVDINVHGEERRIRVRQIHIEEDTGKLLHQGEIVDSADSEVDFNRAGIPLIEIVTQPDVRSAEEARAFLQKLRTILLYTEISDCKMEEGSMRCDANVSLRPAGTEPLGQKTEVKNMNSFRSVQRGIEYEIDRQEALLQKGLQVAPETRHWDENKGITKAMRSKFLASDYRCFPDPNVIPLFIDKSWVSHIQKELPELPESRFARLVGLGLPAYDAELITSSKELADFYDSAYEHYKDAKALSNWIMGDFMRLLKAGNLGVNESKLTPDNLAGLLSLVDKGTISGKIGKEVFEEMFTSGKKAQEIVSEKGLEQISDSGELEKVIDSIIAAHPGPVEDFRNGKTQTIGFLVGQVMKETRGKANPQAVNQILTEKLQ